MEWDGNFVLWWSSSLNHASFLLVPSWVMFPGAIMGYVLDLCMYAGSVKFAMILAAGGTLYFHLSYSLSGDLYLVMDGGTCNTVRIIHRYPWLKKVECGSQADGALDSN